METRVGLFYGSTTCFTEIVAEKLRDLLAPVRVELHNVADTPLSRMKEYPFLILGIPTWDYGELQEDWEARWSELEELDLTGHTVALYGLGDQLGYPQWFQDAMGLLWAQVASRGARTVGRWPAAGYRFTASRALAPDGHHFVGLALDEENEFELTDRRLADWCAQLRVEFPLPQ